MEVKGKFVYGGSGSKKTYDQCVELFTQLSEGKKIWVVSNSPKKYRQAFFKITGQELILEKTNIPNAYNAKLTLTR